MTSTLLSLNLSLHPSVCPSTQSISYSIGYCADAATIQPSIQSSKHLKFTMYYTLVTVASMPIKMLEEESYIRSSNYSISATCFHSFHSSRSRSRSRSVYDSIAREKKFWNIKRFAHFVDTQFSQFSMFCSPFINQFDSSFCTWPYHGVVDCLVIIDDFSFSHSLHKKLIRIISLLFLIVTTLWLIGDVCMSDSRHSLN